MSSIADYKKDIKKRKTAYSSFRQIHRNCWACGATQRPTWWGHAPWLPNERAHFPTANQPRIEDVRVVVSLCTTCHKSETNHDFPERRGIEPLRLEHFLFLKILNDPWHYDPELILNCMVRNVLPHPEPVPTWYQESLTENGVGSLQF